MNIIVPMTGYGSRFVAAGYRELKPMIPVAGKPMIEWIVRGMYDPQEDDFLLICREEHFTERRLDRDYLSSLADRVEIAAINDWSKLGPVYDILRVSDRIDDDSPCMVNYCDFYAPWDWKAAEKALLERNCAGAVIAFTGFQPCLARKKNVYASCLCDEHDDLVEIREKYCFARDRFQGRHSTGSYYFQTGSLLKKYYCKTVDAKAQLNGEYYSSLPYNFLVADGLKVWVPVFGDTFYTWGTPRDLEEFEFWLNAVKGWAK